jgi:hypothetical protein
VAGAKPAVGAKWLVSTDGGTDARWRRDGREIFYRHPSGAVWSADVSVKDNAITTGIPRQLFALAPSVINWDVGPDGRGFLAMLPVTPPAADPISVVLNWSRTVRP